MTTDNTVMNQQIRQSLADRREPRQQAIRDRHAARVEEALDLAVRRFRVLNF